ncbi:hypothetical protein CLPU_49c00040 [Gottschalkia purinilytica]|uniref:Uncharacterized protein n=1 Tax=Gottschalkia purinilytica TaxID=1503 RepID=A0A0L0W649_GOTPU|nr:hypothetical protein [Gottschalkia purinilytica]KNF06956.1 hypothetical protein CLPU_49c00040 [Gottschalkia purinilytica]
MKGWIEAIDEISERNREIDNKLSPNKTEVRYITDFAKAILENANHIEVASSLAHEETIDFEDAQEIIDYQKEQINRCIERLQNYLGTTMRIRKMQKNKNRPYKHNKAF